MPPTAEGIITRHAMHKRQYYRQAYNPYDESNCYHVLSLNDYAYYSRPSACRHSYAMKTARQLWNPGGAQYCTVLWGRMLRRSVAFVPSASARSQDCTPRCFHKPSCCFRLGLLNADSACRLGLRRVSLQNGGLTWNSRVAEITRQLVSVWVINPWPTDPIKCCSMTSWWPVCLASESKTRISLIILLRSRQINKRKSTVG